MTYTNGRVPLTAMRSVAPKTLLLNPVAQAFKNLQIVGKLRGHIAITPAPGLGSGYRDIAMQTLYWKASQGDKAAARAIDLSSQSIIRVASPGYSSHGYATRIDMLFDGDNPNSDHIALSNLYGFSREFGAEDPDHFMHDLSTGLNVRQVDKNAVVCAWLNGRRFQHNSEVVHSNAANTGRADSAFIWMVQHAGHLDKSYPVNCKEDGITGPFTEKCLEADWVYLSTR